MTDEEAMEALLNSDGYSFPTWTLKLGLPTDEMCLVMSLIASDKAPIPVDVAYISEYLHMDGAVVESSVKELLDRRLVYKKDSYRRACCGTAKAQAISTRNGQTENQMSRVLRKENISLS